MSSLSLWHTHFKCGGWGSSDSWCDSPIAWLDHADYSYNRNYYDEAIYRYLGAYQRYDDSMRATILDKITYALAQSLGILDMIGATAAHTIDGNGSATFSWDHAMGILLTAIAFKNRGEVARAKVMLQKWVDQLNESANRLGVFWLCDWKGNKEERAALADYCTLNTGLYQKYRGQLVASVLNYFNVALPTINIKDVHNNGVDTSNVKIPLGLAPKGQESLKNYNLFTEVACDGDINVLGNSIKLPNLGGFHCGLSIVSALIQAEIGRPDAGDRPPKVIFNSSVSQTTNNPLALWVQNKYYPGSFSHDEIISKTFKQCSLMWSAPHEKKKWSWHWPDNDSNRWNYSLGWDCVTMINLLIGAPSNTSTPDAENLDAIIPIITNMILN
ncbi:MAG: hypothetical protein HQK50_10025 [Oligoflexia bacterium]|nr:hypothetical protein [Oligoflexia bacterium]